MLLSPGRNFAIKSALAPRRAKVSSPPRTHVSGSIESRHIHLRTRWPARRPISYQTRSPTTVPASASVAANHQAQVAGPGEGAGTEEEGLSRHRRHKLFDDHAAKEGRIAVRANEDLQAFDWGSPQANSIVVTGAAPDSHRPVHLAGTSASKRSPACFAASEA